MFIKDVNNKNKIKTMKKIIKLTETDLKRLVKKVIKEDEDLGGMTSDPRIMAREYGDTPESTKSPETKAAEEIFRLFDHKIGEWSISPDHRVTQETSQYLVDWKEDVISRLEVIINTVVSEYQEQDIDDELELGENTRTLGGGDETKGGLPKQRGSKHPSMKSR
jgi:hypothetical protein